MSPNATLIPASTLAPIVRNQSVNAGVVFVGVIILLILFVASFYYVVLWPKHELLRYRQKFEELVKRDRAQTDEKEREEALKDASMYGGAVGGRDGGPLKKIPTFRQIESAKNERERALLANQEAGLML